MVSMVRYQSIWKLGVIEFKVCVGRRCHYPQLITVLPLHLVENVIQAEQSNADSPHFIIV